MKKLLQLAIFLFVIAVIAGCGSSNGEMQKKTEEKEITLLFNFATSTLDPHLDTTYAAVRAGIAETLVKINDTDLKIEPWLAKEWKSEDGKHWTFIINDDITFQNGKKVNAEAVKKSLERAMSENEAVKNALKIGSSKQGNIAQGFVTATLVFVIGAMGILGALDSGIRGNHDILYTKSIMDGFISIILTTTLGVGVLFSAIPIILYEGLIALFATQINLFVPDALMDQIIVEMTAAGGIMILAIGTNLIGLTKVKVANLLPGILVSPLIVSVLYLF